MQRVFQSVAAELDVVFSDVSEQDDDDLAWDTGTVVFHHSCRFPEALFTKSVRGIRIVRDPRDVVVSAAHYHCKGREPWLHYPNDLFGGKTYCDTINALDDIQAKFQFEMQYHAGWVIRQMFDADGNAPLDAFLQDNFLTIKYEDLVVDTELEQVDKICRHLSIPFPTVGPIFEAGSLFGKKKVDDEHIRSGKSRQWETAFSAETAEMFTRLHQNALEGLGYEVDANWLNHFK